MTWNTSGEMVYKVNQDIIALGFLNYIAEDLKEVKDCFFSRSSKVALLVWYLRPYLCC